MEGDNNSSKNRKYVILKKIRKDIDNLWNFIVVLSTL